MGLPVAMWRKMEHRSSYLLLYTKQIISSTRSRYLPSGTPNFCKTDSNSAAVSSSSTTTLSLSKKMDGYPRTPSDSCSAHEVIEDEARVAEPYVGFHRGIQLVSGNLKPQSVEGQAELVNIDHVIVVAVAVKAAEDADQR
ncbi:hypothetical protein ACLOJK_009939 [Asimina triloba]